MTFRARPPTVRPLWRHPILRAQSCWFVADDSSRVPRDILQSPNAAGSLGTNVAIGNTAWGRSWLGDGSSTSYLNLGSTNRYIAGTTTPFSVAWVEHYTGSASFVGIAGLFPSGGSPASGEFFILRASQSSLSPSTYGRLSVGATIASPGRAAGFLWTNTGAPDISKKQPFVFIVTCKSGCYTSTYSDYEAWYDGGTAYPGGVKEVGVIAGNTGTGGSTNNSFGWDNVNSKFTGGFDNFRVWNRVLSDTECRALLADPYIGCMRQPDLATYVNGSGAVVGSADPSRYFLAA